MGFEAESILNLIGHIIQFGKKKYNSGNWLFPVLKYMEALKKVRRPTWNIRTIRPWQEWPTFEY